MQLIAFVQRLLKRHAPIRGMQMEDIHTIRLQLLQTLLQILSQNLRLVQPGIYWIVFRSER